MNDLINSITKSLVKRCKSIDREVIIDKVHDAIIKHGTEQTGLVYRSAYLDILDWYRKNKKDTRTKIDKDILYFCIDTQNIGYIPNHGHIKQPSNGDTRNWYEDNSPIIDEIDFTQYNLQDYISRLSAFEQKVIIGHFVHNLSYKEIGKQCGRTNQNAEYACGRAIVKLREMIERANCNPNQFTAKILVRPIKKPGTKPPKERITSIHKRAYNRKPPAPIWQDKLGRRKMRRAQTYRHSTTSIQ